MIKLKNVITSYKAQPNPQVPGAIDILGAFDNIIQPMFPFALPNISLVLTVENLQRPTMFEVRVNAPDDGLISTGEFGMLPDPFGVGKKILDLEQFMVLDRGEYTVDLFEKVAEDKVNFIATTRLFMADYPPQRRMSEEEKAAILAAEGVIKTVRTDVQLTPDSEPVKVQVNLDKNQAVDEGYIAIPEDGRIEVGDKVVDFTGMKRQMEWMFGNPLPQAQEEPSTEAAEEKEEKTK